MLRIHLAGEITLTAGQDIVRAQQLPGRQGRLVFAYLVTAREHAVSRDELSNRLWPDRQPQASEVALSAIVSKLRTLLSGLGLGRNTVKGVSGGYQLTLPADTWIDIESAHDSVHMAEVALRAGDHRAAYGPGVVAASILRRPFLPGEDGAWVTGRRQALRDELLRAVDCLAQLHEANGEHALALRVAREAVELEPFREAGYRRLMLLHEAAGDHAEAVRVYAGLLALLARELGTAPGSETRRLFESL